MLQIRNTKTLGKIEKTKEKTLFGLVRQVGTQFAFGPSIVSS
ncbi:MAG: hypothetical protein ACI87E_000211 [Mariniblastus sp.]|jgi:hypothetical protein